MFSIRKIRPALLLAPLIAPLIVLAPTAAHAQSAERTFRGDLRDLAPTIPDAFEGASAKLTMDTRRGHTRFVLKVRGINLSIAEDAYGAHLHVGPCVAGQPAAALGHYNVSTANPPVVNSTTEVWLDFAVTDDGTAQSRATVPWVPTPGDRSVVIHAEETNPDGTAGTRLACLPVSW